MIIIATHQVAGPQYLLPLLDRWRQAGAPEPWLVFAEGKSVEMWREAGIEPLLAGDPVSPWGSLHPNLIIAGASGQSQLEISCIRAAAASRIPSLQFLDHWVNSRERFLDEDGQPVLPDEILAIDAQDARLLSGAFPAARVVVVGQPAWETSLRLTTNLAGARTLTCILSQPIRHFYGRRLGFDQWDFLDLSLDAMRGRSNVVVSLHPEDPEEIGAWIQSTFPAVRVQRGITNATIARAHTVVGMFSSAMVIAYLAGCRTVSMQPAEGEILCPLVRRGWIPLVRDAASLRRQLEMPYPYPAWPCAPGWLRGSTERLDAHLRARLGNGQRITEPPAPCPLSGMGPAVVRVS